MPKPITGILPPNNVFDRQCVVDGGARWNTATVPELKVAAIVNWFGISDVAVLLEGPNAGGFNREEMVQSYAAIREFLHKQGLL